MPTTNPATDAAASVRKRIEDVLGDHYKRSTVDECSLCHQEWPCDAAALAQQLRDAVEALEAVERDTLGSWETDPDAWMDGIRETAQAALRRMAQGEG